MATIVCGENSSADIDDLLANINGWATLWDKVRTLTPVKICDEPVTVGSKRV